MEKKTAIIAGAGVAGLTAAIELLNTSDVAPIIYEMTDSVGGISKTINYKGNRMDIGGHRFFSKSDRVMNWWTEVLAMAEEVDGQREDVMILRTRLSRIYYMNQFFDYPIKLNKSTLKKLGPKKIVKIGFSYMRAVVVPIKEETSLEDFFINRFGKELYETFFKDYTEKVWGVPCSEIQPEWGAQRIKGISIKEVIVHAIRSSLSFGKRKETDISQKDVETSLIGQFLYPKYGVGQMWDTVGTTFMDSGGIIEFNKKVVGVILEGNSIYKVQVKDLSSGEVEEVTCDYFISTMPIRTLIRGIQPEPPSEVLDVGLKLSYRDFISVGLLLKKFNLGNPSSNDKSYRIKDNWIYVQDNSVKMGRIQVFNNWSPYMVKNQDHIWIGLEYFCNKDDNFWLMKDNDLLTFGINELIKIQAIEKSDVIDGTVVRMPKAYPSYIGAYEQIDVVQSYLDGIENLFLIGRNGMHRYNNMDHSMLTAMEAVDNINNHIMTKNNIWAVNVEKEYHEEKKDDRDGEKP